MTVTHVSIPSHSTRSQPTPHVVFQVNITDDEKGDYTVWKRYNDFVALDAQLQSGAVPPRKTLPPKSNFDLSFQHPFTSWLDDNFLDERRKGLEEYMNSIVRGKLSSLWTGPATEKSTPSEAKSAFGSFTGREETAKETPKRPAESKGIPFKGANSYYLHTLNDPDRGQVLDALKKANLTVVRIFISHVNASNKGSNNRAVNDLEPSSLGQYDDTVLELVDQLMVECSKRDMKLIIACHDRYSLGFWATDVYATRFGIVAPGSSGPQQVADAAVFYNNDSAKTYFDKRIDHILSHKNAKMGNRPWAELEEVIYAIEPQNEPMGHMNYASSSWIPDRTGRIKENLKSGTKILISNGGGVDIASSTTGEHLNMKNVDIVCVHDYSTNPWDFVPKVASAAETAKANGKTLIFEEWGAKGGSKADTLYAFAEACYDYGVPWLIWEVVKPGKGSSDFEIWTDETADWNALTHEETGTARPKGPGT